MQVLVLLLPSAQVMCVLLQAAYGYLLGQVGDALEVMPGEEFRVAVQEAIKVPVVWQHPCTYACITCVTSVHVLPVDGRA